MTVGMSSNETKTLRALVLLPHGTPAATAREALHCVQEAAPKLQLEDSVAWHARRFPVCGTEESYILDVVTGVSYGDRQPYFHGFFLFDVADTGEIDSATGKLVQLALTMGKPVYWFSYAGKTACLVQSIQATEDGYRIEATR